MQIIACQSRNGDAHFVPRRDVGDKSIVVIEFGNIAAQFESNMPFG